MVQRPSHPESQQVWLSMGSNVGNRFGCLQAGLDALQKLPNTSVVGVSSVYETAFLGESPCGVQPDYLNCACELSTTLTAIQLLNTVLHIEQQCGRQRTVGQKNEPRTLDIDLLCFGDMVLSTDALTLPHPRLQERLFVLTPLLELPSAMQWKHPVFGVSVAELQQKLLVTLPLQQYNQQSITKIMKPLHLA
jgi:2-amino-4-hydroxy-6-hydroxymethyldihydropteridine diphosphokinase